MITITLKDGKAISVDEGKSIFDIAGEISQGLKQNALAAKVDGNTADLRNVINNDASLEILTFEDDSGKAALRHTASHLLAQAVLKLYPGTKLAIGPSISDGFYYDFEFKEPFTAAELPAVEEEMKKLAKSGMSPERFTLPRYEALNFVQGEPYKTELINDLPEDEEISFYRQGDFTDLCAGPHVMNTKVIKAVKLMSVAGAYWRGNEKNQMLTRIYGTAFTKQSDLEAYLTLLEEAKKRDHRKLGRELELFALLDEGQGFPFFLPKGLVLKNLLVDYWRAVHKKAGYIEVSTPFMLDKKLWELSGHWENYGENIYSTEIEEKDYCVKPMNCPGGILLYKQNLHSYREFPLRMGELGIVHRHEKSGTLHGLMRVRCFTQDDAHIYITPGQIKDEIKNVVRLVDEIYNRFGFSYMVELSTRPEKSIGTAEQWDIATEALRDALNEINKPFKINEGDGAFYGPKIDFHLVDTLGRPWQCGTIQLDFNLPERLDMEYISSDGQKQRPVMIHRTIYGSLERFMGILIEHYAGHFPLWLAPVQVMVLPISDKYLDYAESVRKSMEAAGFRAETDRRSEKIGYKIREAHNQRIPYILVTGENEERDGTVSLRSLINGDEGAKGLSEVIERLKGEIGTMTLS